MPIARRSLLGGALLGLGAAGQNFAVAGVRRKTLDDQHAFELQKLQLGEVEKLQNNLALHPEQTPFFLESAKANPLLAGIDLSPLASAARTMGTQQLTSGLNAAPTPEAMPADLGQALTARTGRPAPSLQTSSLLGQFGQEGQQEDPTMNLLAQTAGSRLSQLSKAEDDKTALLGARKYAENFQGTKGTGDATHELAPIATQDLATQKTVLGPIEATNAGLSAGAQEDARNASDLKPDVVKGKANAAGQVAGAEASARINAELNPAVIAKRLDFEKQKHTAALLQAGQLEQAKAVNESVNAITGFLPQWSRLKQLSAKVNTKGAGGTTAARPFRAIGGATGAMPDIGEMDSLSDAIALKAANSIGGNRGQTSENDRKAMRSLLPSSTDTDELAKRKIANFDRLLLKFPQALAESDLNATPEMRLNAAMKLMMADQGETGPIKPGTTLNMLLGKP